MAARSGWMPRWGRRRSVRVGAVPAGSGLVEAGREGGGADAPTGAPAADLVPAARPEAVVRFRDPSVNERLDRDGYARLGPFLSPDEVDEALAVFDEAHARLGTPLGETWFPTILLPDDEVRALITDRLGAIVRPHLEALVEPDDLEVVRLDYSVKPPSERSALGPHQDYALVDERRAQSLYLWIPLCDTGPANGTLHVVPGSHRFANRIRSRHVPAVFDEVLEGIHEASVRLDCRAGELVAMVSGVIHHSPPNRSGVLRLAAHGIVKPASEPLVLYYADDSTPAGRVECFELDIGAYVQAIHHGRPEGEVAPVRLEARPPGSMSPERFRAGLALVDDAADATGAASGTARPT